MAAISLLAAKENLGQTLWRDYITSLAQEQLGVPQQELAGGAREVWVSLLDQRPLRPHHGKAVEDGDRFEMDSNGFSPRCDHHESIMIPAVPKLAFSKTENMSGFRTANKTL